MGKFKNLERVVCKELEKMDRAYENKDEFSEADAKKYDMLVHAWKSHLTAEAMHNEYNPDERGEESSYARGRNMHTGRYMSRDDGMSGHYPPQWMYPPRSYGDPYYPHDRYY